MKIKRLWLPVLLMIAATVFFFYSPFQSDSQYTIVPIRFLGEAQEPVVEIKIEGNEYSMAIDTGAWHPIFLHKKALDRIKRKNLETTIDSFDLYGTEYQHSVFTVPPIQLGRLTVDDIPVNEEDIQFLHHGSRIRLPASTATVTINNSELKLFTDASFDERVKAVDGRIGVSFLLPLACLFDCSRSNIILGRALADLKQEGFLDGYIPISLENKKLPTIAVETDWGKKMFLLDTGTDFSLLNQIPLDRDSPFTKTEQFRIGNQNYGSWEFVSYPFGERYRELDGILGLDFFKQHPVCFDFQNKQVWIQADIIKKKQRLKVDQFLGR